MGFAMYRLLALLLLPTQVLWAQTFDVVPAWGGRFAEGRSTEIAVWLSSPAGGEVRILSTGTKGSLEYSAAVEADRPHLATLPASPGPDGRLEVTATLPNGLLLSKEVRFLPQRERFVVEIVWEAMRTGIGETDFLRLTADALPRSAAGYGPLAALVLHTRVLASLDADQTTALSTYLEACRPLGLAEVSPEVLERVRAIAGCSGRYVTAAPPNRDTPISPAALPDSLPTPPRLQELSATSRHTQPDRTALLLLPYPILLLASAGSRRPGAWLLLIPAGATLILAWVLPMSVTPARAATWAEMDAGESSYRFVSLLDLAGNGHAQAPLRLPAGTGVLWAADSGPLEQRISDSTGTIELALPSSMLQHRRYRLEGTRPSAVSVGLEGIGTGVRLTNRGSEATPAGWLSWHGKTSPVPPLPPGSTHMQSLDAPKVEAPFAGLGSLAATQGPVLVLPASHSAISDSRLEETAWLAIRMRWTGS